MSKLVSNILKPFMNSRLGLFIFNKLFNVKFGDASGYWEHRYAHAGTSGAGSYGEAAIYKANIINAFIRKNNIHSVVELGSGDGNQIRHFEVPKYTGLDVSKTIVRKCEEQFAIDVSKKFVWIEPGNFDIGPHRSEVSMSLDVIYHLISDEEFCTYLNTLFSLSTKFVIIYSWVGVSRQKFHIRHRNFKEWLEKNRKDWKICSHVPSNPPGSFCDFYIYETIQ